MGEKILVMRASDYRKTLKKLESLFKYQIVTKRRAFEKVIEEIHAPVCNVKINMERFSHGKVYEKHFHETVYENITVEEIDRLLEFLTQARKLVESSQKKNSVGRCVAVNYTLEEVKDATNRLNNIHDDVELASYFANSNNVGSNRKIRNLFNPRK